MVSPACRRLRGGGLLDDDLAPEFLPRRSVANPDVGRASREVRDGSTLWPGVQGCHVYDLSGHDTVAVSSLSVTHGLGNDDPEEVFRDHRRCRVEQREIELKDAGLLDRDREQAAPRLARAEYDGHVIFRKGIHP